MGALEDRLHELEADLQKCDYFINQFGNEAKLDLMEAKHDYEEACRDLEQKKISCEREFQSELTMMKRKGYSQQQINNTRAVLYTGPVENAEDYKDEMLRLYQEAKRYVDEYPAERAVAIRDRVKIVSEIQDLRRKLGMSPGSYSNSKDNGQEATLGNQVLGLIFLIILFFTLKSCLFG